MYECITGAAFLFFFSCGWSDTAIPHHFPKGHPGEGPIRSRIPPIFVGGGGGIADPVFLLASALAVEQTFHPRDAAPTLLNLFV